jgi:hypothetical protein
VEQKLIEIAMPYIFPKIKEINKNRRAFCDSCEIQLSGWLATCCPLVVEETILHIHRALKIKMKVRLSVMDFFS